MTVFNAVGVIRKKRDREELSVDEITAFIDAIAAEKIGEAQIACFCMAIFLNKLTITERAALTKAMLNSGRVLTWDKFSLKGPILDKHSTGGVGDKTSLIIAPLLATCGVYMPMIAGRALGHTGGTIDKLESIPNLTTNLSLDNFQKQVATIGTAIIAANHELAPADKKMYAVRDISASVESIDLITASILSKKLAAGIRGLVMDVKVGSGAFANSITMAQTLAQSLIAVGRSLNLDVVAVISDMNEILGKTAGNSLEITECISFLKGEKIDHRLYDLTLNLCAELLLMAKLHHDKEDALQKLRTKISNGSALEKFAQMLSAQGAPTDFIEKSEQYLPISKFRKDIYAQTSGMVQKIDVRELGLIINTLGGGRLNSNDKIDHSVGFSNVVGIGDYVDMTRPLLTLHYNDENNYHVIIKRITDAFVIGDKSPSRNLLVAERYA